MTPDIERMAREAGLAEFGGCTEANLERFAALVRAQALEEAAKVCDSFVWWEVEKLSPDEGHTELAKRIRALKR